MRERGEKGEREGEKAFFSYHLLFNLLLIFALKALQKGAIYETCKVPSHSVACTRIIRRGGCRSTIFWVGQGSP